MGTIPRKVSEALDRSRVPDNWACPSVRSMAQEDRRVLSKYIDTLLEALDSQHCKYEGFQAAIESKAAEEHEALVRLLAASESMDRYLSIKQTRELKAAHEFARSVVEPGREEKK